MEIKQLLLRLSSRPNRDTGDMTGPEADAHVMGYTLEGWVVHTVSAVGVDNGAVEVYYLLTRKVAE